jgi:transcriptional regulator with XRE-family HTH domain
VSDSAREFRRCLIEAIGPRTQESFAAEIGIDQSTLSRWLNGSAQPSRRLAAVLLQRHPALREPLTNLLLGVEAA